MQKLCAHYDHPEKAYPIIHVAGTNGKGSVCKKIASCLEREGYKIGLYTSPHISSFRERIQMNEEMISEEEAAALGCGIRNQLSALSLSATFFEIATLMAFLYFRQHQIDAAVVETGLGGTWDATNVVQPILSIITSIGYDHQTILGSSLEEIAQAKGGIIKEKVPLVIGPRTPHALFHRLALEKQSALFIAPDAQGDYDAENREIARLSLSLLRPRFPFSEEALQEGLVQKPPCRFEVCRASREIVFDGAHNPDGIAKLLQALKLHYPGRPWRFLLGFSKDKDLSACAKLLMAKACAIHLAGASHPRLSCAKELQSHFFSEAFVENSVREGLLHALALSQPNEVIIVTGSFFLMDEAKRALSSRSP